MKHALGMGLTATGVVLVVVGLVTSRSLGDAVSVAAVPGTWTAVGALLVLRRTGNAEGWLVLAVGVMWGVVLLPVGSDASFWPAVGIWVVPLGLMGTQVLLRFPDGALPDNRWRWFSVLTLVVVVALTVAFPFGVEELDDAVPNPAFRAPMGGLVVALLAALVCCIGGSVWSLVVRFRRAGPVQREQVRWIVWAAAVLLGLYVLALLNVLGPVGDRLALVGFALFPLSVGVAVTRYHLYDIDRIISRTASYALVSAAVLLVYAAVVTTVPRLLPASSSFAVAVATLAAAGAARPLLSRARRVVDRRFNREHVDAEQTVEVFGMRLRDEVDPGQVVEDLVVVARRTMQPTMVGVWQRGSA